MLKCTEIGITILIVVLLTNLATPESSAKGKGKIVPQPKPDPSDKLTDGKHFPEIPSMKLLSKQQYQEMSNLIQLVVLDDVGMGPPEPRFISKVQARRMMEKLPVESLPLMIQAITYCNKRGWTCPSTILAKRMEYFTDQARRNLDLDLLEYSYANLQKDPKVEKELASFMGARSTFSYGAMIVKGDLADKYKKMPLADLIAATDAYQKRPTTKHATWRFMIRTIPQREDKAECIDLLIGILEKSVTASERKTVHGALVKAAGVDNGPSEFNNRQAAESAVSQWKAWRKSKGGTTVEK